MFIILDKYLLLKAVPDSLSGNPPLGLFLCVTFPSVIVLVFSLCLGQTGEVTEEPPVRGPLTIPAHQASFDCDPRPPALVP